MSSFMQQSKLWLPVIKPLNARTAEEKEEAMANDKASHARLKQLRNSFKENRVCGDCGARNPGWVALPHGTIICIDCAQVHRNMGRHISQTKSFSSGTYIWYADEIAAVEAMGNKKVNKLYLAKQGGLLEMHCLKSRAEVEKHIKNKYNGKWFIKSNDKQVVKRTLADEAKVNEAKFKIVEKTQHSSKVEQLRCLQEDLLLSSPGDNVTSLQPQGVINTEGECQQKKINAIMAAFSSGKVVNGSSTKERGNFFAQWGLTP